MKKIPIGIEFYKEMVDGDYYYVDKTLLIKGILDAGAKVSLFTRPRRFGKTLALSMLQTFFEDERDENGEKVDNSVYFAGKKIVDCEGNYLLHMGKYPVINLTLKSAKQPDYAMAYSVLCESIAAEFRRHRYILAQGCLLGSEVQKFESIMEGTAKKHDYVTSLEFLSYCLKQYHNQDVIVLLDEYDVPLENSYFREFYQEMTDFIRSLFESALKTNRALKFAVVTGCLRISKESIFTGLNHMKVLSVLRNDYAEAFGFNGQEVQRMLEEYQMGGKMEEVQRWYDGYVFGKSEIYNPWSIINYVDEQQHENNSFPKPYWSNTSSNSIIKELIEKANSATRAEIEMLIDGGSIEKPIHEEITYEDVWDSQDNLWNFLFFTGYLKKVGERFEGNRIYLQLAIPNEEIRCIYRDNILLWFGKRIKALDRTGFYAALAEGKCGEIEGALNDGLRKSISFHDAAEQFYHGFMVGMLSDLAGYDLKSNRETGDGRADIVMEPEDWRNPVMVFEFKVAEKFSMMAAGCEKALRQIEEKHYDAQSKEVGYTKFIKYGICFCKKACKVKAVVEQGEGME